MPSTPTTVVSPDASFSVLLNHVPTTAAAVPFTCAWTLSCGAKFVMLNAQKIVLIFAASDSFRNEVGSASDCGPPSMLYRSDTTASDFGCTVMFEPYVLNSALSLSPTSNTTPSIDTDTVADRHTVSAISRRLRNWRVNERLIILRKNMV